MTAIEYGCAKSRSSSKRLPGSSSRESRAQVVRSASTERGVNAAATSFRIRVCSGGSSQSRLQRSVSQNACQRGSSRGTPMSSGAMT